jgi:hypothetical protein
MTNVYGFSGISYFQNKFYKWVKKIYLNK